MAFNPQTINKELDMANLAKHNANYSAIKTELDAHDTHVAAQTAHGSTSAATAGKIMQRDSAGRAKVAAPSESDDIARKAEVDVVQTNLDAHGADSIAHLTSAEHTKLTGIADGAEVNQNAFAQVNNVVASAESDTLTIAGGTGITVSSNPTTKTLTVTATGDATPGAHGSSHNNDGADPIPDLVAIRAEFDMIRDEYGDQLKDTMQVANVKTGFGAVGDGVADDTAAFVAAFSSGSYIGIPPGTYKINQMTVPSSVKLLKGYGEVKLVPGDLVPAESAASWVTALGLSNAEISGISFEVDSETYPELRCLDLTLCINVLVERVHAIKGGGIAIYGAQCNYVTVRKCKIESFSVKGISFDGAQQSNNTIEDNVVIGTGLAHCISAQLGTQLKVTRNFCKNTATFGIGLYQVTDSIISDNTTLDTGKEGINIEDSSSVTISGNICKWTTGTGSETGTDFGISVFGNAVATQFNSVTNNTVVSPFASGIALADNVSFNLVSDNQVLNANQGSVANHAGILLYGADCLKNKVTGNNVTDTAGTHHNWGIAEYDFGTGSPMLNEITNNRVEGYAVADIKTTNTTTITAMNSKDLSGFRTYTPTVSASAGSVGAASATGHYLQIGKLVLFYARVTVSTNGSGAGALRVGLPFTAAMGSGSGKEIATSGRACTVEINADRNYAEVRVYDNSYPAANGSIVDIIGIFQIS
ncbi:right-handed parallel beta-helix repeat-containing protein [Paenibacillus xylanilyticus]|uniref:right-handed parallel beta-helix repeat-containing protein n=1 Tax=Paenibacillus xylanilyticus TaxID=248903 RepID=UPI00129E2381|nr:right-handed parallel beta-helix repeat-containing protein [Paenibacillus xylanilyticus]